MRPERGDACRLCETPIEREALREPGVDGEFDPGSGLTLAACLMHASRAGSLVRGCQRRTGEEHVADRPWHGGYPAEMLVNPAYALLGGAGRGKALRGRAGRGLRPISWTVG